ncbi:MAG: DNA helicase [Dehalococcoidia bacterium]|nr:DNA helicase [Dehalococcoidia bacterium]
MPDYPSLILTDTFLRSLLSLRLTAAEQRQVLKSLALLEADERHPSLRVHLLQGTMAGTWSASASDVLRIRFTRDGNRKVLLDVSRHYDT